ncbi:pilin polypeptide [Stanieria cyanosphaera PCC 7437]|uniref:Pilin polypeptide n=1 Tax=Stanieria cyanosphaera (strain ATCC 29371 / PCC 7437) TaxID=111780 RepID=K9XQH3_STAC7|nr:type IV pilin-like G/H family protein [Stanieria cyanosphaera]AFZ34870.1 pilin polypeptide [Stanieria cyanosphaera PCC 7437]
MNNLFAAKLLQNLRNKKGNKGFTLIELLVVVIIIGVLAAVALPNLLGQVSKGRQAEAKTNLGALNRAQQTNRLEKATFANITNANFPVKVTGQYYDFTGGQDDGGFSGVMTGIAKTQYENDVLDYAAGVAYFEGTINAAICEETAINAADQDVTDNGDGTVTCVGNPVN